MDFSELFAESELEAHMESVDDNQFVALISTIISDFCIARLSTEKSVSCLQRIYNGRVGIHTGSTAEFYIKPPISCIGDIDVMTFLRNTIVVPDDCPKRLVSRIEIQMDKNVKCYKPVPHACYKGFVYLELVGEFLYCWNGNMERYIFHKDHSCPPKRRKRAYLSKEHGIDYRRAGPAMNMDLNLIPDGTGKKLGSMDHVFSYHCPFWPDVATEWKTRPRPHGCPDSSAVDQIVLSGCDIVTVSHPDCREDESMMRWSFSRAEVYLLKKWTHKQQVVFHMLRYFAKEELMPDNWEKENKILCTYHIKTLMMWSCESDGKEFWDRYAIEIGYSLLTTLSNWLNGKVCENYFIPGCNLFSHIHNENNLQEVIRKLGRFESSRDLGEWFHKNYFKKSIDLYNYMLQESQKLSVGISTVFQKYFHDNREMVIDKAALTRHLRREMEKHEFTTCLTVCSSIFDDVRIHLKQSPLASMPRCLPRKAASVAGNLLAEYAVAIQVLILAKNLKVKAISSEDFQVYDYIGRLYKQFEVHNFPNDYHEHLSLSRVYFIKAEELMSGFTTDQLSDNEDTLLTELSIQCLKKSLNCKDSNKGDEYPVSIVYLAALYFKVGKYQHSREMCLKLMADGISTKRKAKGRLLIFIDDVSNILGFLTQQKCFNNSAVNNKDIHFTPEIIALYLINLCAARIKVKADNHFAYLCSSNDYTVSDRLLRHITTFKLRRQLFAETCLATNREIRREKDDKVAEPKLVNQLMEIYCEKLATTFEMVRRDFGPRCFGDMVLTALYRYRCHHYDEVLRICNRLESENPEPFHELGCLVCCLAIMESTASPIDLFYDDDIHAVVGLQLQSIERVSGKTAKFFIQTAFLAKYLKLLCFLETHRPVKEVLAVYRALTREIRNSMPVEHMLIYSVGQELCRILRQSRRLRRPYHRAKRLSVNAQLFSAAAGDPLRGKRSRGRIPGARKFNTGLWVLPGTLSNP